MFSNFWSICTWWIIPFLFLAWLLGWLFWQFFRGSKLWARITGLESDNSGLKTKISGLEGDLSSKVSAYNSLQGDYDGLNSSCLLYTSPSPRDATLSRMPSSA